MKHVLTVYLAASVSIASLLTGTVLFSEPANAASCKFQTAKQLRKWLVNKATFKGRWKGGTRSGSTSFTITPRGMLEWDGMGFPIKFLNGKTFKFNGGKGRGPVSYTVTSNCRLIGKQLFPKKGGGYWIVSLKVS